MHRGVHLLSERATDAYEEARADGVPVPERGRAAGDRLRARHDRGDQPRGAELRARRTSDAGDEVVISAMEHHSNIVPVADALRGEGRAAAGHPDHAMPASCDLDEFEALLSERTKIVAVVHVSNALGTINPVDEIVRIAHGRGIPVLVDGAQAVAHMPVDVQALDCDFYAFSGHKIFGPTGIGVLYGKAALLDAMPPYQGGGDMISSVTFERTLYNVLPYKFEAGTPNIAGAIGLAAALEYVEAIGLDRVNAHEHELLAYGDRRAVGRSRVCA